MSDSCVAIRACGCWVAATVDRPEWRRDTAKTVAQFLRDGYTVERHTTAEVRERLTGCIHRPTGAAQLPL